MVSTSAPRGVLLRYSLQSLASILLLALILRLFVVSSYAMSGSSMLPNVWPGDFLLGSRVKIANVRRGDVVALRCPMQKDRLCLRRVLGLPGDRVEFRGGGLWINGQAARYLPSNGFEMEVVGGGSWGVWPLSDRGASGKVVVSSDHLYVLNDRRPDRADSRVWGPIPLELVEARVVWIWMSLDWYDGDQIRQWPHVRWHRLFRAID